MFEGANGTYSVHRHGRHVRVFVPVVDRGHAQVAQVREQAHGAHEHHDALESGDLQTAQCFPAHARQRRERGRIYAYAPERAQCRAAS